MKSNTKTALVFLAILAAAFLIALLGGGAAQSAAEDEEEGTLIGVYVSEEDIDIDDLEVTATGKFRWKQGRLYAEKWEKSWYFPDLPDGGGLYSALRTETEGVLAGSTTPQYVSMGEIKTTHMANRVYDDNGVRTTDIDLSGEVYICGDEHVIFNFYPIYQADDGRIYMTRGNSMGMSGSDGGSMTHTLTSDKTEMVGGKSERVKVKVAITAVSRATPTKFTVAHMDENDQILKLEEFAPDALPESIIAADGAAYLIGTGYGTDWDGEKAEYTISSRGGKNHPYLETFAYQDGRLKAASIWVNWKEGAA